MASKNVDGVLWGDYTYGKETSKLQVAGARSNEMDKDAFLKLLMAQMKYQDPLNPMDDKEFVAQMAQFTSLEQMQNLNQSYSKSQAYDMIGRTVTGTAYIEETGTYIEVEGTVTAVKDVKGEPVLVVGEGDNAIDLALTRVENVYEDHVRLGLLQNINNNVYNTENLQLIGQEVQAILVDEAGKPMAYIEGKVDSVKFGVNGTMLVVGEREISPGEVISVGEGGRITGKNVKCWLLNSETGEMEWLEGIIEGVKINGENNYVLVKGKEVPFEKFDQLSKALNMVGSKVISYGIESTVESVGIQSGVVYLLLADERQLLISDVKQVA